MSDAHNFSALHPINPYYFDTATDTAAAQSEHESIYNAFIEAGIKVTRVPSPTLSQDGVYTANWALVRGDTAVLARLPNIRKAEEDHARSILESIGKTVHFVPKGLRFSGQGDALACGDYLFCGKGYRSDEAAQKFAADVLGYKRIQLQTVPQLDTDGSIRINPISGWEDSFYYDIDLALSILRAPTETEPALIAYCKEAFTPESQHILASLPPEEFETILIPEDEARHAFAANLVSTGSTVIMSSAAPALTSELRRRNFSVITPSIQELAKGGGYIRCTSLTIHP